jgi:hypothetical protein
LTHSGAGIAIFKDLLLGCTSLSSPAIPKLCVVAVGQGEDGTSWRSAVKHAAPARASTCFDLWVQRNSIYKAYGYCFKTSKAINYFGNAGCSYDNEGDIPLSHADRSTILAIKKTEQSLGCL